MTVSRFDLIRQESDGEGFGEVWRERLALRAARMCSGNIVFLLSFSQISFASEAIASTNSVEITKAARRDSQSEVE